MKIRHKKSGQIYNVTEPMWCELKQDYGYLVLQHDFEVWFFTPNKFVNFTRVTNEFEVVELNEKDPAKFITDLQAENQRLREALEKLARLGILNEENYKDIAGFILLARELSERFILKPVKP